MPYLLTGYTEPIRCRPPVAAGRDTFAKALAGSRSVGARSRRLRAGLAAAHAAVTPGTSPPGSPREKHPTAPGEAW
ncbi:MAG: hypothetical protein IPQ07_29635 [Myxococcales bacterium]|nr:hypothetical protein [Myxococcales bacterium]